MKILILSTKVPYPARDGGAIATLNLALGLAEAGSEVHMLAMNTRKHFISPDAIPENIRNRIRLRAIDTNTEINFFALVRNFLFSREPYIAVRFNNPRFREALTEELNKENYDIVQMEGPYLSQYMRTIRSFSRARVALRAHNAEHEIWERKARNESSLVKKLYLSSLARRIRNLEKQLMKETDYLVAITERDREKLQSFHPGIIAVTIPAGIDIKADDNGRIIHEASICFIGSLDWMPNQEGLEWFVKKVLPLVIASRPDVLFHVAGRNAPEEWISEIKHPAVIYHGEVEDARAFLDNYSVMAVPLLTGSGIRIKILEGMALGKCVVTTPVGAEGIGAVENEHLVIAADAAAFAEKIIDLLDHRQKMETMSAKAKEFVREKFDTFAIASSLAAFYNIRS